MPHLYAISDTHISFDPHKQMDVFDGWANYMKKLETNWNTTVDPTDTVVIAGDISWADSIEKNVAEFRYLQNLNGKKILLKGNHDNWWKNIRAMHRIIAEFPLFPTEFLRNNCFEFGGYGVCGATGVDIMLQTQNETLNRRNILRIETSLKAAIDKNLKPLLFLHYPPILKNEHGGTEVSPEILDLINKFGVSDVYYGHIHGENSRKAYTGKYDISDGKTQKCVNFHFIAADFVHFMPILVV
jgi:predicted phosphohydrolase